MKNKQTMIGSTLAVLVVILGVAAFLAYTRSAQNVGPIPVTGRSNSGASQPNQIVQQNQAANSSVTNNRESAEQVQAEQSLQALKDQAANSRVTNTGESPEEEYILSQQYHPATNSSVTNTGESPEEEYILSQQNPAAHNSSVTNTGESPEEEYILSQQYHAADNSRVTNTTVSDPAASQPALQVTEFCPFTAAELQTLHTVYYKDINVRMLETKDGPIGYDGGAFALSQCRISK